MQYAALKNIVSDIKTSEGSIRVSVPADIFRALIAAALKAGVNFDEQYYISKYSDIKQALNDKKIGSAEEHYCTAGYFEDRLPRKILVDEEYYLKSNPDVEQAIRNNVVKSAQEHFENAGFKEGRAPFKNFALF